MIVDLTRYPLAKRPFIEFLDRQGLATKESFDKLPMKGEESLNYVITRYAVGSHCPIVVLALFAVEEFGDRPELEFLIRRMFADYRHTGVIGFQGEMPEWLSTLDSSEWG